MSSFGKVASGMGLAISFASLVFAADEISATREIAPTGSLRVAIAVGPAASTFWATRDPASGEARGVTVELAKAAAARLHVPLKLVAYQNPTSKPSRMSTVSASASA